jgi:uncharacterized protein YfaP (DUF2135 family)
MVDRPAGGWVYDGLVEDASKVQYAYPNNLIDRGGQRGRTLIQGQLKKLGKATRVPLLVVNAAVHRRRRPLRQALCVWRRQQWH